MKRLLFFLLLAPAAFAHDTFLTADGRCGPTTVHLTSGMQFPALDFAIAPERVMRATVQAAKRRVDLKGAVAPHALDFQIDAPAEGLAIVAVELSPKTLELTPSQVSEYLDEIAAPDDIRERWKAHPDVRWRETYTKHAKTFVHCGGAANSYLSTDMGFEIFPQVSDLYSLHAGDPLRVIAVHDHKTLMRNFPIILERDGGPRLVAKSGSDGIATFTLPGPGRYMLSATYLRPADSGVVDWVSDFSTLTFEIK